MAKMIHPNLIRCYIAITKGNTLNIIVFLMSYGDLSIIMSFKYSHGLHDEVAISTKFKSCLIALDCMNSHKFFHRDIKASNIFFASDGSFRLGDYGISASLIKEEMILMLEVFVGWLLKLQWECHMIIKLIYGV